jgi:diguanylate cyclase (GGDEF)-like protein
MQAMSPRLLVVEGEPTELAELTATLNEHFGPGSVRACGSLAEAVELDPRDVDLVITELDLPDGSGRELLDHLLDLRPDMPVIVVTDRRQAKAAMEAIRHGATDYLVKAGDYLFAVPLVVEKTLATWRTKQENVRLPAQLASTLTALRVKNRQLEDAVRKLETMATTDPLTGLANRRAVNESLDRAFAEAQRYGHDLACIMIDLDGFKACNDTLGHQAGDEILQRTARVLEASCRRSDIAGRFGGDEFVILLPQTGLARATRVAQRIAQEMRFCVPGFGAEVEGSPMLSLSMGVATLRHSRPATADELVRHADTALYDAKGSGKNRLIVFDPPNRHAAVTHA